jgi:hypothetical protein
MGISKDSALVSTGKGKESRVQGKAAQAWLGSWCSTVRQIISHATSLQANYLVGC